MWGSTPGAENLAAVLGAADIFVDVAPGELTGRMLLSAMACGAVPVAADTGVALEITAGGRDGLLVDAGAPDTWATAIAALAQDWPRLRELRRRALAGAAHRGLAAAGASRLAALERLL